MSDTSQGPGWWPAYFAAVMIVVAHTNVNGTIGLPAVAGSSGPVPLA